MLADQAIRNYIYHCFVETGRPPTIHQTAHALNTSPSATATAYTRLHDQHAIYLQPGSLEPQVRMANPFSAVPTPFTVRTPHQTYFANCAWDMLGIPAALHTDATSQTTCPDCGEIITIEITNGRLHATNEIAHFLIPFRHWYDNLLHT